MHGLHIPERLPGETQAEYRARQRRSRSAATLCATSSLGGNGSWQHDGGALQLRGLGDQHKAPSARERLRDHQRLNGKLRGTFAFGVINAAAKRRAESLKGRGPHDEHGAYTLAGRKLAFNGETIRRKWLAGISAQRGY